MKSLENGIFTPKTEKSVLADFSCMIQENYNIISPFLRIRRFWC